MESLLPYPFHAPPTLSEGFSSKAEDFARAFAEAQNVVIYRIRMGEWIWPWSELFRSKTKEPMRIVDSYLDPILKAAVEKANQDAAGSEQTNKEEIGEDDTLLDHLVRYTKGKWFLFNG